MGPRTPIESTDGELLVDVITFLILDFDHGAGTCRLPCCSGEYCGCGGDLSDASHAMRFDVSAGGGNRPSLGVGWWYLPGCPPHTAWRASRSWRGVLALAAAEASARRLPWPSRISKSDASVLPNNCPEERQDRGHVAIVYRDSYTWWAMGPRIVGGCDPQCCRSWQLPPR